MENVMDMNRLESCARRIEAGGKLTVEGVMIAGQALAEARAHFEDNISFGQWRQARLPWLSRKYALRWRQIYEEYGALGQNVPTAFLENVGISVLAALAAPSTPDHVRDDVAARAAAGEQITVAEVERLKREAKAAREAAARFEAERSELLSRVTDATSREQEARDHLRLAREQAVADRRRAVEEARAAMLTEAENAKREAEIAKAEAEKAQAAFDAAVLHARQDAEQSARDKADALAEEAVARRRGDLAEIERRAKAAEDKAQRHFEAEQRLAAEIRQHQEFLARTQSAEREVTLQIEAADQLMAALSDAMISLHGFEHAPLPQAARKLAMAQQMCTQMADAIAAFLAPRVPETRP